MATASELLALKNAADNYLSALNKRLIVQDFGIIETDDELALLQGTEESFETVFNEWKRISRHYDVGDTYGDSSIPSELETWSYDDVNDRILCTENTASYVGFISPTKHDDYVFEVRLNSDSTWDDDQIGICIAYATDTNGDTHTLDVIRTLKGYYPMFICKDYGVQVGLEGNDVLASVPDPFYLGVLDGLEWSDGTVADGSLVPNGSKPHWGTLSYGCKIRVTRSGDTITVETTQLEESTYHAPATTVIDLTSDPKLDVFRGPQQFGYTCRSQDLSYWETFSRPGSRQPIYDIRDKTLHEWDGTQWTQTTVTENIPSIIKSGRFYINPQSKKLFFTDDRSGVKNITGIQPDVGTITPVVEDPITSDTLTTGHFHIGSFVAAVDGIVYFNLGITDENATDGTFNFIWKTDFYSYDPSTGNFTQLANVPRGYLNASAVVAGGLIYVVGGLTESDGRIKFDVYDPVADSWSTLTDTTFPTNPQMEETNAYLYNGDIIFAFDDSVYLYDITAGTWSTLGGTVPHTLYNFAPLNGLFYTIKADNPTPEMHSYDPSTETWTSRTPPDLTGTDNEYVLFPFDGKLYKLGGSIFDSNERDLESYDPVSDSWTTHSDMPAGTEWANCVYTEDNGDIYILSRGASDSSGNYTTDLTVSKINPNLL